MSVLKALVGCEGLAFAPLRISASKDVLARRGNMDSKPSAEIVEKVYDICSKRIPWSASANAGTKA